MPTFPRAKADGGPIPFTDVDQTYMSGRRRPGMFPPSTRMTPPPFFRFLWPMEGRHQSPSSAQCCHAVYPAFPRFLVDLFPSQPTSVRYIFAKITRVVQSSRRRPDANQGSPRFFIPTRPCFVSLQKMPTIIPMFPHASADVHSKL